jgi:hypothetical protein
VKRQAGSASTETPRARGLQWLRTARQRAFGGSRGGDHVKFGPARSVACRLAQPGRHRHQIGRAAAGITGVDDHQQVLTAIRTGTPQRGNELRGPQRNVPFVDGDVRQHESQRRARRHDAVARVIQNGGIAGARLDGVHPSGDAAHEVAARIDPLIDGVVPKRRLEQRAHRVELRVHRFTELRPSLLVRGCADRQQMPAGRRRLGDQQRHALGDRRDW